MEWNRLIQKNKKWILSRDALQISAVVVRRCTVKKSSINIWPVYLHIIKIDMK